MEEFGKHQTQHAIAKKFKTFVTRTLWNSTGMCYRPQQELMITKAVVQKLFQLFNFGCGQRGDSQVMPSPMRL